MGVAHVTLFNEPLIDLRDDTVTPDKLASGVTAHDKDGNPITGTMSANSKSYKITLAKSSGWVLLTTLDDEVISHINDKSLMVSLKLIDDYAYVYYAGNTYIVGNTPIAYANAYAVYGMCNRTHSETASTYGAIHYPANKNDTSTSIGGVGMFRRDGNKYYVRPGDGFVYPGTYKLTFAW